MRLPKVVRRVGKEIVKASPFLRRNLMSSVDYRVLSGVDEARQLLSSSTGWFAARTVARQARAYRGLIASMKQGQPRIDLKIAAESVAATGMTNPRLLEVGCGSGYYSEVLSAMLPGEIAYCGVDYSPAMIADARRQYPGRMFEVADATRLPYAGRSFDIVFNGVSLMHMVDYQAALRETARVTGSYCVLHGVPVFPDWQTTFLTKYAYGAPVVEVIFGKPELMSLCHDAGLRLIREWPGLDYDPFEVTGHHSRTETYLFAVDLSRDTGS
jgi:ubiquinone/menaquinone biosynthesis C-methylase UbiE